MIIDRDRFRASAGKGRQDRARRRAVARRVALERLEDRALMTTVPGSSFLTGPNPGQPLEIALGYLARNAASYGIGVNDLSRVLVTNQYTDANPTVTHLYLRQSLNGLPVDGSDVNVNIAGDGSVINVGGRFSSVIGATPNGQTPVAPMLTASDALSAAARALGLTGASTATLVSPAAGARLRTVYSAPGMSLDNIPVQLQYVKAADGSSRLSWELILRTPGDPHWYDLSLDATSGTVLRQYDWIDAASYNVFQPPTRSPNDGPRTVVVDPQLPSASPYGWHNVSGGPTADYTITRGNNVWAGDGRNMSSPSSPPANSPDGGSGLNFNFPLDLNQDPSAYTQAASVQLFFTANTYHDILYQYGFNEAAGNFQQNNFGRGGLGNDPVYAYAQFGATQSIANNAFFATPPDGSPGYCVMFVWTPDFTGVTPVRDGDLDNEIVLHEMTHGLSNRLTGGPANANALDNLQSAAMGEGWSDFVSVMLTMKPTDTSTTPRYIGNYATGLFNNGNGVRRFPYSYDMTVNPLTLGDFNPNFDPPGNPVSPDGTESHNGGEIWSQVLQDVAWNLIDKHGFNSNLAAGYTGPNTAGNVLALKLVVDAMKLQPANPTYLEARDAILLADKNLTGGANYFSLWKAFARRGFGVNASDDGNSDDYNITEDFTLPPSLQIVNSPLLFAAVEGTPLVNVQVAQLTDDAGLMTPNNYQVTINWGDGSATTPATLMLDGGGQSYRVLGSHQYDHAGTYSLTISAISTVMTEAETGNRSLTVLDMPLTAGPVVPIAGNEATPFSGKVATFTDTNPAAIADPAGYLARFSYTASITWGDDGSQSSGTVLVNPSGGFDVFVSSATPHLFLRGGVFQIAVTVTDVTQSVTINSTATVVRAPLSVSVAAIPPNPANTLVEGSTFSGVVGTIRGPLRPERAGDFQVAIDWGDGTPVTTYATVTTAYDPVAQANYFVISSSHLYKIASTPVMAPLGYYPVNFLVTDYDNTQASPASPAQVVVAKAPINLTVQPPTVNVGGLPQPMSLVDGQSFTETIGWFIDTNRSTMPTDYVARINWGDGTTSVGTVKRGRLGVGSYDVVGSHAYPYTAQGHYNYTVSIYRTDEYNRYQSIIGSTPGAPIADPFRAQGTSSFVVNDAPINAQGVTANGVVGVPTQPPVATFTVNSPFVTASQYTAQINWGDGTSGVGVVTAGASSGAFVVNGSHAYRFGTFTAQVVINSQNGSTATATSTFTIGASASTVAASPVSAVEGIATGPIAIATFSNPDIFAGAGQFQARINWGDGSPISLGTVSGSAAGGYSVLSPSHTYPGPGTFPLTVTIAQANGRLDSAASAAVVAVRVEPINGGLASGIDPGVISTAAVTRVTQPTIVGHARAYATVELFAQAVGQSSPTLLGTTSADGSGNYTVSSSVVLVEGSYTLTVDARNGAGQIVGVSTPVLGTKPYIVDLTPPSVASSALQAARGRFVVTFSDNVGLNPAALLNPANYDVRLASTGGSIRISSLAFDATAGSSNASRTVIVTLANGKRLAPGNYVLGIKSAGLTDAAGNHLVETRYTAPPVNSLTPSPDFLAMYRVGNPNSVGPQVYISPVSVNGAQAYLLYLRGRPRVARRG